MSFWYDEVLLESILSWPFACALYDLLISEAVGAPRDRRMWLTCLLLSAALTRGGLPCADPHCLERDEERQRV